MNPPALLWFRRDLRLSDNLALHAAVESGAPLIPVFIWSPEEDGQWAPGAASRWWLHHSLQALQEELRRRGSRLILRRGRSAETLASLADESGARSLFFNRLYSLAEMARDAEVEQTLQSRGLAVAGFPGDLLKEPGTVLNSSGRPFQVFTAFHRAYLGMPRLPEPHRAPAQIQSGSVRAESVSLSELALLPKVDWAGGLREAWQPGEEGARNQMGDFLKGSIATYASGRDRPAETGTSRVSPHLHFGEISPRQVWQAVRRRPDHPDADSWLRQIAWREFAHHLLFHFPETPSQPLRPEFRAFPWHQDASALKAWTRGRTGYPLVDAGMRELWHTGWMHNRVRMVAASFLVKHLLIPWQEGASWFWDTLVDADLANNTMGWQWVAGCGADAAPYFRIFNPVLQGEKFDPNGDYVRRWVPELENLPAKVIHQPWKAGHLVAGKYPEPIVNHEAARQRALAALARMKATGRRDETGRL